jgi:EmrB/QacA subfamily drug resistance transporter
MEMTTARRTGWTLALVSAALFMVTLDNLVVTTALPSIHRDLGGGIDSLEWTVNAYTLSFAVLLLTGAALGDRFGRRRMFSLGLAVFTLGSAAAALAPSIGALVAARALQGAGGALVTPLTLTLLSEAFPQGRRGVALGIWSGISGLGVALGPVIGGAVVDGFSWHWIFWLNVPIGLAVVPLARLRLSESFGPAGRVDIPGLLLASGGLFGVVFGLVRANALGWTSTTVLTSLAGGAVLLAAFAAWETRAASPMLPLRFFRSRAFSATNAVSLAMYFGMFGSIFLLAQFFQIVQHYSPLQAGLRTLPWTGMPILVAPVAGILSDRIGSRPLMFSGLALQSGALAWLVAVLAPGTPYTSFIGPFILAGAGMAMVFAPAANAVLSAVRPSEAGQASGATNAIRELGGVLGIAVLASVFSATGGYASPSIFVAGLRPAVVVGAAVLGAGAIAALAVPGLRRRAATATGEPSLNVEAVPDAA